MQNTAQTRIAGVDEVGRGPLAGAVVAAAVILDPNQRIEGLADSKKLSQKKREHLFEQIQHRAIAVSVGRAEPLEIDELNILQASRLAMVRAVQGLCVVPTQVLVDGRDQIDIVQPCEAIIGGDGFIQEISAASIIAKVTRDREMQQLDTLYPGYGFAAHKGYPTQQHLAAIEQLGVLEIHRRSFRPIRLALQAQTALQ